MASDTTTEKIIRRAKRSKKAEKKQWREENKKEAISRAQLIDRGVRTAYNRELLRLQLEGKIRQ